MIAWKNLDTTAAYKTLQGLKNHVCLQDAMSGESGAKRVKEYSVPMAGGLTYNYAAKQVDGDVLAALKDLAEEMQLTEKYAALYNGEVINTGEKRLVLHQLTRGQLGEVVQIGIGGSDLGPRAMYLALENWAKQNGCFKLQARFISNVDPDDAASILKDIDVAHSLFVLVSKSGTTLETLTNESFVKDALRNAGLDPAKHMVAVTHQRNLAPGQEQRLPGRLLHGRLHRRPLFLYLLRGRRGAVPGLRSGYLRPVLKRRGRGRQAGDKSRPAQKPRHAGRLDRRV